MKKISILVLSLFVFSCSKKDMITYGTGVGTGLSGYTISNHLWVKVEHGNLQ